MAHLLDDNIDFSAYMTMTDAEHRCIPASSYCEEVIRYFHDTSAPKGDRLPWDRTHGILRFRPGEVTLWGGMNGHGKSLLIGQTVLGFIAQNRKTCIASMEMKPLITLARICRQAEGTTKPDIHFIREFHEITDGRLWLYDQQGTVNSQKMLAVIRYCADKLAVNHFVIDSLMKCGIGEDDYNRQKGFVDELTSVARDTGIHIHLVAHSRKGKDELAPPGKMDVRGSASITDQVDNVITCWRNKAKEAEAQDGSKGWNNDPDALMIIDKQRNGEWEGRISLWFVPGAMQFVEDSKAKAMNMLRPL